jgi:hypothetical protein
VIPANRLVRRRANLFDFSVDKGYYGSAQSIVQGIFE